MMRTKTEPFTLPELPYKRNALEPYISAATLNYHYNKHHQAYVTNLNELVSGTEYEDLSLEEIILQTSGQAGKEGIFNNAAQTWNHTFYWNSLAPSCGSKPSEEFDKKICSSFGSYEKFIKEFAETGVKQFGSGWVWLVEDSGTLKITKTPNAENPMSQKHGTALLTLDVWEHAYYLDYHQQRDDYLATVLDQLIHWDFAEMNLANAVPLKR